MKTQFLATIAAAALLSACSGGGDAGNKSAGSTGGGLSGTVTKAPAGSEWTATISQTAEGGYRMGNPEASVKLIEYGALSCPHCAKFSRDSTEGLKALVAKGTMSYEFRPFMIHPQDVPAFLLAGCNGPQPFFAISEQMFAQQDSWLGKSGSITEEEQKSMQGATPLQVAGFLAGKLELDKFVEQRGVPKSKAQACLADQKALDALAKVSEQGVAQFKISGTPTFILNGQVQTGAGDWASIEPLLKAAGA